MYLDYYNLKTEPFQITPDPEFLYLSPSHREALATITYAVEQGKGFMALVGEVGLGKTTLLQSFLQERQGVKEKVIYLFNSRFSYGGLLRALARELDLEAASEEPEELLNHIYQALIREYAQGNNVILLIDEAQGLPEETLEGLRLISNLETPTEKLLQIILVGQPELTARLDRYELRQLKQRIAVQAVLSPLTRKESREYLRFRLEKAGGRAEDIFTRRALEKISPPWQGDSPGPQHPGRQCAGDRVRVPTETRHRQGGPGSHRRLGGPGAAVFQPLRPGGLPGLPVAVAGGPGGVGLLLSPPRIRVEGLRYPAQGGPDPPADGCPRD